ncbi:MULTISPECIES: twin-arginine translocation signal domain-containing protein [Campylobacter]
MQQNRRDFLKWSSLFGGLALTPMQLSSNLLKTSPMIIKWA